MPTTVPHTPFSPYYTSGYETCQALFDGAPEGVAMVDLSGVIIYCNPTLVRGLGLKNGDILAEAVPGVSVALTRAIEERQYQTIMVDEKGEYGSMARIGPVMAGGKTVGAIYTVMDVEMTKSLVGNTPAVDRLIRERDAIIKFSSAGLWICDEKGTVLLVNPSGARLNNVDPEEVTGHNMMKLVESGSLDRSVTIEVLKKKTTVDMLLRTREGRRLVSTGHPIFDENGELIRVVVTERDITELEALHQKLQEQEAMRDRYRMQMIEMQELSSASQKILIRSPNMMNVLRQALKVSKVESTVLILGESGVGKELIAGLIHKHSDRANQAMIRINCGAIPESLIESEIFGYEKGAFTGASTSGKPGYLEMADGGVLFLDEVAELPLSSQVKLLRVLEDGSVDRLGSTVSRKVDVRILAATNRHLEGMVTEGTFRKDLYYRLNVIPLFIPPLRDRKECLTVLLHHYLNHYAGKMKQKKTLAPEVLDVLLSYSYPGNVRELINICERLAVLSDSVQVTLEDLPREVLKEGQKSLLDTALPAEGGTLQEITEYAEKRALVQAREQHRTQMKMAEVLGVTQATIARKMKKYGLG